MGTLIVSDYSIHASFHPRYGLVTYITPGSETDLRTIICDKLLRTMNKLSVRPAFFDRSVANTLPLRLRNVILCPLLAFVTLGVLSRLASSMSHVDLLPLKLFSG